MNGMIKHKAAWMREVSEALLGFLVSHYQGLGESLEWVSSQAGQARREWKLPTG